MMPRHNPGLHPGYGLVFACIEGHRWFCKGAGGQAAVRF